MPHHGCAWVFSNAGQRYLVVDTQRVTDDEIQALVDALEGTGVTWPDLGKLQDCLNGDAHTG